MKLQHFNCPDPQELSSQTLPTGVEFLSYLPDFERIKQLTAKYAAVRNILLIAHGGSINTFNALYQALPEKLTKQVYVLSTIDPDYIFELKHRLKASDTLVIAISKSGETTTQLEALLAFADYPMLFITGADNPLAMVAAKLQAEVVDHPPIGGRYTGFTEVALLPAAIAGLDAEEIFRGGRDTHNRYQENNSAWQAASILWQLELQMYVDVFMPVYSHHLFPASSLIVQLCHESFGKNGKGQTYFAHEAPESQHHTNQRFFGGRKNIAAFVLSSANFLHSLSTTVPEPLWDVAYKSRTLQTLDQIPLAEAMNYERQGVIEHARLKDIPLLHLSIDRFDEAELGRFIAFWQLFAVYSSVLRQVDAFDQPEVETSKKISFDKRLQFKGLL